MERIVCPGCLQSIRVPEEALGQRAQCPFCKCHFEGPIRQPDGSLTAPALIMRNPFARSRTVAPGVMIFMVGSLGFLINSITIAQAYSDPEAFAGRTRDYFEELAEKSKAPELREWDEFTIKWWPIARIGFLCLSALNVAGGIAMIRQRYHSLAMLGAVGSLFNVANCCCMLGFPAGGWALYVLMNPEVRAQFNRPKANAVL